MIDLATDERAILEHVHGLFAAFLRKDREAIRRGHTADWRGFQIGSRTVVRGIDAYMAAADQVLEGLRATRYEMLDTEVVISGDVAVVYYLARDYLREDDGSERTVLLRSVDVYRREAGAWNQCGSNICVLPDDLLPEAEAAPSQAAAREG